MKTTHKKSGAQNTSFESRINPYEKGLLWMNMFFGGGILLVELVLLIKEAFLFTRAYALEGWEVARMHSFYLFLALIIPLISVFFSLWLLGSIRGNAVRVTHKQFPLIMGRLEEQTKKLGMAMPAVYIIHGGGWVQAFAARLFFRNYIVLYAEVVATAQKKGGEEVLAFILGHELAHIRRGHLHFLKNLCLSLNSMSFLLLPLVLAYERSCEYTCDAIGHYLAPKGAKKGITLLAVGRHLYEEVDEKEFIRTGTESLGISTAFYSFLSSHPHLVNRLTALQKWN